MNVMDFFFCYCNSDSNDFFFGNIKGEEKDDVFVSEIENSIAKQKIRQ